MTSRVVPIVLAGAALVLGLAGCGRHLPAAPTRQVAAGPSAQSLAPAGLQLANLMRQANAIVRKQWPQGSVYEANGRHHNVTQGNPAAFDSWVFRASDDDHNPNATIVLVYKLSKFAAPVERPGVDMGREVAPIAAQLDLHQAIAAMGHAAPVGGFDTVDLYKSINPLVTQPYYIFTSATAIVTVGAQDGAVERQSSSKAPL